MSVKNETPSSVETPMETPVETLVPAYDPGLARYDDVAVLGKMTHDGPHWCMED